uniref:Uncharacterized protein n=1 Tax=Lepeophtheirus salmonis TaxID=72036 RepID=A0A0K2V6N6_LEPSM
MRINQSHVFWLPLSLFLKHTQHRHTYTNGDNSNNNINDRIIMTFLVEQLMLYCFGMFNYLRFGGNDSNGLIGEEYFLLLLLVLRCCCCY